MEHISQISTELLKEKAGFTFNSETHIYRFGGRIIPSVTGILKDAGIIKFGINGSELQNERAMSRGKAVHAACHYLDDGNLQWNTVDDELIPYIVAYEKFKKDTNFKPNRIEERLFNSTFCFAGTLDREGTWNINNNHTLIDLKTGSVPDWTALQTAGYDLLLPTLSKPRERYALQLKETGDYALVPFRDSQDKNLFLSLVSLYWWKQQHD
jgi:hypothetical protein